MTIPTRERNVIESLGLKTTKKSLREELKPGGRLYMLNPWNSSGTPRNYGWKGFVKLCSLVGVDVMPEHTEQYKKGELQGVSSPLGIDRKAITQAMPILRRKTISRIRRTRNKGPMLWMPTNIQETVRP
jgi:hypothetical protein